MTTPTRTVPPAFSAFLWEPWNEQQVVLLFGMLLALKRFPEPLCIETCDTTFPDCVAFNPVTEERVKIEFEYRSSAFLEHKHEWLSLRDNGPKVRWMIVCWDNDLGSKAESLRGVEIVELKRFSLDPTLVRNPLPSDLRSEKMTQTRFDWRVASIPPHQRGPHVAAALARLRNFGENNDLGFTILWPRSDNSVKFSIVCQRHGGIRFGASAKGTIGIPFSKWHLVGDDVKALVIEKLKVGLPHLDFTGHARRKKGYDVEVLLPDERAVEKFLEVWRDVVVELDRRGQ